MERLLLAALFFFLISLYGMRIIRENENLSVFEPEKKKFLTYANIHLQFTGSSTYEPRGGILTFCIYSCISASSLKTVEFTSTVVFYK